jgi:hypothetical protein
MNFKLNDSGKRTEFSGGMVRDTTEGKTHYHRVFDGPMCDRWAEHLTKGAVKYPDVSPGRPNWMLAQGEEELARFKESAVRHFRQWLRGDTDEDHAAAVFFNINGAEFVREKAATTKERFPDSVGRTAVKLPLGSDTQPQDRVELMRQIVGQKPGSLVVSVPRYDKGPEIPKGYIPLNGNDIIESGDEWFDPDIQTWTPSSRVGYPVPYGLPYRRKKAVLS